MGYRERGVVAPGTPALTRAARRIRVGSEPGAQNPKARAQALVASAF